MLSEMTLFFGISAILVAVAAVFIVSVKFHRLREDLREGHALCLDTARATQGALYLVYSEKERTGGFTPEQKHNLDSLVTLVKAVEETAPEFPSLDPVTEEILPEDFYPDLR